jgi:chromosome segregation ATPase
MNNKPRPDLKRQDVEDAIKKLRSDGKDPTIGLIEAITGGSRTTITRFKHQIEADELPPTDSPEALTAFRSLWDTALKIGADQRTKELGELRKDFDDILAENERLEVENSTAEARLEKLREQQTDMQEQLTAAHAEATQARANCEIDARRLAEVLAQINLLREQVAAEEARLRDELSQANAKVHEMEVRAAGITTENNQLKARLAAVEERNARLEEQNNRLETQVRADNVKLADARAANSELAVKLANAEIRASESQKRYHEKLPPLREKLDAAVAKCHETELHLARLKGQLDLVKLKSPTLIQPTANDSEPSEDQTSPKTAVPKLGKAKAKAPPQETDVK